MEKWMPLLLDAVLMISIFVTVFYAAKKGFVAAAIDLVGYVLSLVGSWMAAKLASQWIFDSVLRPLVMDKVSDVLDDYFTLDQLEGELEKVLKEFPSILTNSINFELEELLDQLHKNTGLGTDLVSGFTDAIVAPAVIGIVQVVIFLILFSILICVVRALSRLFQEMRHLPVLGLANSLLGGAVGLIEVVLLVFAFTTALHLLFVITDDSITWLCSDIVRASNILSKLYEYNPLLS